MTSFKRPLSAAILAAQFITAIPARAQETVIKFATLAPDGSTWMRVMHDFNKELQAKTGGKLKFKFYPGGVSGDEKDVVRKMRIGQLHAAGVTGVGLGEVSPEIRVVDAPFLFRSSGEIDHVLKRFWPELRSFLEAKGFASLGWAEVGFVYLFTNAAIVTPADMKKVKMWVWEGDQIAEAALRAFGINPVPLSITDVMTSLQTGLIDGVYGSPMGVIALQWFTKTKYIYSVPLANASGSILVSKKFLDGLPEDQRKTLLELGETYTARLTALGREENRKALDTLQKQGLTLTKPASPDALKDYEEIGRKARRSLAGGLFPAALLDKVEKAVDEFRLKKDGKAKKD